MSKKTITNAEFNELSKVMDQAEILNTYNLVESTPKRIDFKKYLNISRFLSYKLLIPVVLLAVLGGGYFLYTQYTNQVKSYDDKVAFLESAKQNLELELSSAKFKIKSVEKNVSDLESKVSDKESIISQKERENSNLESQKENAESKSKDLAQQNTQATANAKANQNYLIDLGNVKACIMSNLSETSYYRCTVGYQPISCFGFVTHTCTYNGASFSCSVSLYKSGIENCK